MPDIEDVVRAARAGQVGAETLFPALADAQLLLAVSGTSGQSATPWLVSVDGTGYAAVFTAREHAADLPVPAFAELSGRDLGAGWPDGLPVALNPGSTDVGLFLDSDAMHSIGATDRTVARGSTVFIGAPATPPAPELVEAVRAAVREQADVSAAYAFQLAEPDGPSRLVIGVVIEQGQPEQVVPAFARAVTARYPGAGTLDFLPLDGLREQVVQFVPAID